MGRGLAAVMGNVSEAVEQKEIHLWAVDISILQLHKIPVSHERWHDVPATARSALAGTVGIFLLSPPFHRKVPLLFLSVKRTLLLPQACARYQKGVSQHRRQREEMRFYALCYIER